MKALTKLLLLIFVVGLVLSVVAFFGGLDVIGLRDFFNDAESYGDQITYTETAEITTINIDVETRNINIVPTASAELLVMYHVHEKDDWVIEENNGILTIYQNKELEVFNWFNFKFVPADIITVYIEIPDAWVVDLDVISDVGNVTIEYGELSMSAVNINSATGNVNLSDLDTDMLNIDLNTGNVHLDRVNVLDDLFISTDTGRVSLDTVTALNVFLESNTGSVIVDELIGTALTVNSDTGTIEVKNSEITNQVDLDTSTGAVRVYLTTGSGYDLSSSTGSVTVTLTSLADLRYDLQTSTGDIDIDGDDQGNRHSTSTGSILLKVRVSTGNISIQVLD
jgi:DUF4097 and DUF4098 domain-containing protein YvlB